MRKNIGNPDLLNFFRSRSLLFLLSAVTCFLGQAGCSVESLKVANNPPDLQRGLQTFSLEHGSLRPESVSIFLWPRQNEFDFANTIAIVGRASAEIDRLSLVLAGFGKEKASLEAAFAADKCVVDWAVLAEGEDPEFVEWVQEWKPDAPQACKVNQDRRKSLLADIDKVGTVDQAAEIGKLYRALDPLYPSKIENIKSVNVKDSRLVISLDGSVTITLKDYLRRGNTQSSVAGTSTLPHGKILGAQYISSRKLLVFAVPELSETGEPTARLWKFYLERAPDFLGMARFVGDIQVYDGEKLVRAGTAKIEGRLK